MEIIEIQAREPEIRDSALPPTTIRSGMRRVAEPKYGTGTHPVRLYNSVIDATARDDAHYMERALQQARQGAAVGEVPVGAVIIRDGSVVAEAHNLIESTPDATAHAEMLALQQAAKRAGSWRLDGMTLYVTLEPCPMCAGAMVLARLRRLVYGAPDPKKGAVDSVYDVLQHPANNHGVAVTSGVLAEPSATLLRDFFAERRQRPA
jgi:tRNA(adenine34) deaminase